MGQGGVGGVEEAEQVELDHAAPLLHRGVDDGAEQHDAGVVDQRVEPPEGGRRSGPPWRGPGPRRSRRSRGRGRRGRCRSASASSRSRRRAATATEAPCAARATAVAWPMPLEAPVTRATVPSSRSVMGGPPSPRCPDPGGPASATQCTERGTRTTDGPACDGASGQAADLCGAPARVAPAAAGADRGVVGAPGGGRALVERAPVGAVVRGRGAPRTRARCRPVRSRRTRAGSRPTAPPPASTRPRPFDVPPFLRSPCSHRRRRAGRRPFPPGRLSAPGPAGSIGTSGRN